MLCRYHFQRRFLLAVPSHALCYVLRLRLAAFVVALLLVLQAKGWDPNFVRCRVCDRCKCKKKKNLSGKQ